MKNDDTNDCRVTSWCVMTSNAYVFNYCIIRRNNLLSGIFSYMIFWLSHLRNKKIKKVYQPERLLILWYFKLFLSHFLIGRGKKKEYKKLLPWIAGIFLIKGAILPIAIGKLKLLVGKALLITVMALMLISIISLKKISSGGHSSKPQVSK